MSPLTCCRRLSPKANIGVRFALAIFAFGLLGSVVSAVLHIRSEQADDVRQTEARLQDISQSYRDSVTLSLWNMDHMAAVTHLAGLVQIPDMVSAHLIDSDGDTFAAYGERLDFGVIESRVRLTHQAWGESRHVGDLLVQASLSGLEQRARSRTLTTLITESIKGVTLSAFALLLFHLMVGRHLHRIARKMARNEQEGALPELRLNRAGRYGNDDLGRVVTAFEELRDKSMAYLSNLKASEARANAVIDNLADGLMQVSTDGHIERVNKALLKMFGYTEAQLLGQDVRILKGIDTSTAPPFQLPADNVMGVPREVWGATSTGVQFPGEILVTEVEVDSRKVYLGLIRDLRERKAAEDRLWRNTYLDALTGLPNRKAFLERLSEEMLQPVGADQPLAVIAIDLDRFKDTNDALGVPAGDHVLREIATRLQMVLGVRACIARLSADEFAVCVRSHAGLSSIGPTAEALRNEIRRPIQLERKSIRIGASMGISVLPIDRAADAAAALRNAELAMHLAKSEGGDRCHFFKAEMQQAAQDRLELVQDLSLALELDQFSLVYQPVVNLRDGSVHKAEALLRWNHPERGFVSPARFIPLAEESGVIHALGDWVFHQAAEAVLTLRRYTPDFQIAVNTSPAQYVGSASSLKAWADYLGVLELPGQSVAIEITEGLLMDRSHEAQAQLAQFQEAGMEVSIDDFGTGYSSLSYLKRFKIDYLKIDQSFVRQLAPGHSDLVMCSAIIVMAHELGIRVIAEGIETEEQRDLLMQAGCDFGQGYLFARPMPMLELQQWLQARSAP